MASQLNMQQLAQALTQQATPAPHYITLNDAVLQRTGVDQLITSFLLRQNILLVVDPASIPDSPPATGFTLTANLPSHQDDTFFNLTNKDCSLQFVQNGDVIDFQLNINPLSEDQKSVLWTFSNSFGPQTIIFDSVPLPEPTLTFATYNVPSTSIQAGLSLASPLTLTGVLADIPQLLGGGSSTLTLPNGQATQPLASVDRQASQSLTEQLATSTSYILQGPISQTPQGTTFDLQASLNVAGIDLSVIQIGSPYIGLQLLYVQKDTSSGEGTSSSGNQQWSSVSQLYVGANININNSSHVAVPLSIRAILPLRSGLSLMVFQVTPATGFITSINDLGELLAGNTWDEFFSGPAAELKTYVDTFGLESLIVKVNLTSLSIISLNIQAGISQPWSFFDNKFTINKFDVNWVIIAPTTTAVQSALISTELELFNNSNFIFDIELLLPDMFISGQYNGTITLNVADIIQQVNSFFSLTLPVPPSDLATFSFSDFSTTIDIPNKVFTLNATANIALNLFGLELLGLSNTSFFVTIDQSAGATTPVSVTILGTLTVLGLEFYVNAQYGETIEFEIHMVNMLLGDLLNHLVHFVDPTYDISLPAPWDKLLDINLDALVLKITDSNTTQTVSLTYDASIDLGFIDIENIGLTYTKGATSTSSVQIELSGTFLGQQFGTGTGSANPPLGWDAMNGSPPAVPGAGGSAIDIQYIGLGQHIAFTGVELDTVQDVMKALRQSVLPTQSGQLPPFGQNSLSFSAESNWLIGAQLSLMNTIAISAIFNDPNLYGVLITLSGAKAKIFAGLSFEILYRKVTDTIGVYHIELKLPDAMRNLQFGEVSLTLPVVILDIYTNGNFRVDFGFPLGLDFSNSFSIQVFPFIGYGGFYFALLDGATSSRVPQIINGTFSPVIEFGVALSLGVGKTVDEGILKGGISITVIGILQGVLAWFHPTNNVPEETYYWFQGTISIVGKLYATIDFAVIQASVDVTAYASVTLTIESHQPIYISMSAGVSVRVSLKIVFFTVHFSFSATIHASFTIGSATPTPWQLASSNGASSNAARRLLRGQQTLHSPTPRHAGYHRALRQARVAQAQSVPITTWPAVCVLPQGQQTVTLWAMPAFTKANTAGQANAILLLTAENSIHPNAPTLAAHRLLSGNAPASATFNLLMQAMLGWGIYVKTNNKTIVTADQLEDLRQQLQNPDTIAAAFDYTTLYDFLAQNFIFDIAAAGASTWAIAAAPGGAVRTSGTTTITTTTAHNFEPGDTAVVGGVADASFNGQFTVVAVPSATTFTYQQFDQADSNPNSGGGNADATTGVAIFPMIPDIQLTDTAGTSIPFNNFNNVDTTYQQKVRAYFQLLQVQFQARNNGNGAQSNLLAADPKVSMATVVFGQYFNMLMSAGVKAAIDLMAQYPYIAPGAMSMADVGTAIGDVKLVQEPLRAVMPNQDASVLNTGALFTLLNVVYQIRANQTLSGIASMFQQQGALNQSGQPYTVNDLMTANVDSTGIFNLGTVVPLSGITYTTQQSDTLNLIAVRLLLRAAGASVLNSLTGLADAAQALLALNTNITDPNQPLNPQQVSTVNLPQSATYAVVAGDTLTLIAGYGIALAQQTLDTVTFITNLLALNTGLSVTNPTLPQPLNTQITMPSVMRALASGDTIDTLAITFITTTAIIQTNLLNVPTTTVLLSPQGVLKVPLQYSVAPGDTFNSIAAKFNLTLQDIADQSVSVQNLFAAQSWDITALANNGAVRVQGTTTITTTAASSFAVGDSVTIKGVADNSFNGQFTVVSVPSTTTFTYAQTDQPNATSGNGTVIADKPINISDLPSINVATLMDNLLNQAEWNNASGMVSRFLLSGLRLPDPNDTNFQNLTLQELLNPTELGNIRTEPLFALTGQQYPIAAPAPNGYEITLTNSTGATWFNFNASNSIQFGLTPDQQNYLNILAATPLANELEMPTRLALFQMVPPRIVLQNHIAWQAALPPAGCLATASATANPDIWLFPDTLVQQLESLANAQTSPLLYELVVAKHVVLDAPVTADQAACYAWGTMIDFTVSLPVTDGAAASIANAYVIEGADDDGAALLEQLYGAIATSSVTITPTGAARTTGTTTITTTAVHNLAVGDNVTINGVDDSSFNGQFTVASVPATTSFTYAQVGLTDNTSGNGTAAEALATLYLLYTPNPTSGNPTGLVSDEINAAATFILKTNLSTLTHSGNNTLEAMEVLDVPQPGAVTAAACSNPADFIALLWQASITRSGGFYLNYVNQNGDAALPATVFGNSSTATLSLLVMLNGQAATKDAPILPLNNCVVVGDHVDTSVASLFVQPTTYTVQPNDSLTTVATHFNGDWGTSYKFSQVAAFNQQVPLLLQVGSSIAIPGQNAYSIEYGDTLESIVTKFGLANLDTLLEAGNNAVSTTLLAPGAQMQFAEGILQPTTTVPPGTVGFEITRTNPDPDNLPFDQLQPTQMVETLFNLIGFSIAEQGAFMASGQGLPTTPADSLQAQANGLSQRNVDDTPATNWYYSQTLAVSPFGTPLNGSVSLALPAAQWNPYNGVGYDENTSQINQVTINLDLQDTYGNIQPLPSPYNALQVPVGYYDEITSLGSWPSLAIAYRITGTPPQITFNMTMQQARYIPSPGVPVSSARAAIAADLTSYTNIYYQVAQPDFAFALQTTLDANSMASPKGLYPLSKTPFFAFAYGAYIYLAALDTLQAVKVTINNATTGVAAITVPYGITAAQLFTANQNQLYRDLFDTPVLSVPTMYPTIQGDSLTSIVSDPQWSSYHLTVNSLAELNQNVPLNPGVDLLTPTRTILVNRSATIAPAGSNGAVRTGGITTITTTAAHNFAVGDTVVIANVSAASFNGTFVVATVPGTTTFTYLQSGQDDLRSGSGTATDPPASLHDIAQNAQATVAALAGANETPAILLAGAIFTVGTQSYQLPTNDSLANVAKNLNVTVGDLATANQWLQNVLLPNVILNVADVLVPEGATLTSLAQKYAGGSVDTLATSNENVENLFAPGTAIQIGPDPTPTHATKDDTLITFAGANKVTVDQLGIANSSNSTVFANGAKLYIPNVLSNTSTQQYCTYTAGIAPQPLDTLHTIAQKFGKQPADIAALNPDIPGLLAGGQTVTDSTSGKSVPTQAADTLNSIIARFADLHVTVSLRDLAADIASQTNLVVPGSLWICPPMSGNANTQNSNGSLSGLAVVYNTDVVTLATANAAALGCLASGVSLTLWGVTLQTTDFETFNSLVNRVGQQGVTLNGLAVTIADVANAVKDVPNLINPTANIVPIPPPSPTGNNIEIKPNFSASVFQIAVNVLSTRSPQWVDPDFTTVSAVQKSVYGVTPEPTPQNSEDSAPFGLKQFASDLQQAITGLHIATGDPVTEGDPASANTIWAVNFGSDFGPVINYQFSGANTQYFALPPLSTTLMGGSVPIAPYVSGQLPPFFGTVQNQTFQAVDLDTWLNTFLQAVDVFLSPGYAVPAYTIAPAEVENVVTQKQSLAQSIAGRLQYVLQGQAQGSLQEAQEAMRQALLTELSSAFTVDTVVQVPVAVKSPFNEPAFAPRLSGKIIRGKPQRLRSVDTPLTLPDAFSFSTGKVALTAPTATGTFLFSVKAPAEHKEANLDLEYVITELEMPDQDNAIGAYNGSSWLKFILPLADDHSTIGSVDIPIPLRSYPSPVTLISQTAQQTVTQPSVASDLRGWNYDFVYQHDDAEQDTPLIAVTFNPTANMAAPRAANGFSPTTLNQIFNALARFMAIYPALKNDLALLPLLTPGATNNNAVAAITAFSQLVSGVATAWLTSLTEDEFVPPTTVYYYQIQKPPMADTNATLPTLTITSINPTTGEPTSNPTILWPDVYVTYKGTEYQLTPDGAPTSTQVVYRYPSSMPNDTALPQRFVFGGSQRWTILASNGAVRSEGTTTIITTAAHGLAPGNNVAIAGVTDVSFNGLFTVLDVPSPTSFTYAQTGVADSASGNGMATPAPVSGLAQLSAPQQFQFNEVNIIGQQSGRAGVSITRNLCLVKNGTLTNPAFVYQTPFANFTSSAIPSVFASDDILIGTGQPLTVAEPVGTFLQDLLFPNRIPILASNGAVRSEGTTTIITTAAHGLAPGNNVAIAGVTDVSFNGLFTVLDVPSPTSFTYAQTGVADSASGNGTAGQSSIPPGATLTIRFAAAYSYALATDSTSGSDLPQLDAQVPIMLVPSFEFDPASDWNWANANSFVAQVQAVVENWYNINLPLLSGGSYLFSLTIYSGQGQLQPLIQATALRYWLA